MLRMALMGILLLFVSGCAITTMNVMVESQPPHYDRPVIRIELTSK